MLVPGAKISTQLPQLEKEALVSLSLMAPTVNAVGSRAGLVLHAELFLFAAAATTIRPFVVALRTAVSKEDEIPALRDKLATARKILFLRRAIASLTAQFRPAITPETVPEPLASMTFTATKVVLFATP